MYYSMRQGAMSNPQYIKYNSLKQLASGAWIPVLGISLLVSLFLLVLLAMRLQTPNVPAFVPPASPTNTAATRELTVTTSSGPQLSSSQSSNTHTNDENITTPASNEPASVQSVAESTADSTPIIGGRGADETNKSQPRAESSTTPMVVEEAAPSGNESEPAPLLDVSADTPLTEPIEVEVGTGDGLILDLGL